MSTETTNQTVREYLDIQTPTNAEARAAFRALTTGDVDPLLIAALLATIRTRGASAEEIQGAAEAFLEVARSFPTPEGVVVDCVGTGGDRANTINISTAAALAAAATGVTVIKHGNRSVSSKSGAADVLEALNIPLDLDPERAGRQLAASNFTFLFAPGYHPAFKHVVPIRQTLKVPTIFNVLGPLINPAQPSHQVLGIANPELGPLMIAALQGLGRTRALVVHGAGTDEIAVWGETKIWELRDGEITHYTVTPADLGLDTYTLADVRGGEAAENAALLRKVFSGTGAPAHRDAIAASLGALFYLTDRATTLRDGVEQAVALLDSGSVARWLAVHEEANYA